MGKIKDWLHGIPIHECKLRIVKEPFRGNPKILWIYKIQYLRNGKWHITQFDSLYGKHDEMFWNFKDAEFEVSQLRRPYIQEVVKEYN